MERPRPPQGARGRPKKAAAPAYSNTAQGRSHRSHDRERRAKKGNARDHLDPLERPPSQESQQSISDVASQPSSPFNTPREGQGGGLKPIVRREHRRQRSDPSEMLHNGALDAPRGHDGAPGAGAPAEEMGWEDLQAMCQRIQQLEQLYVLEGGEEDVKGWDTDQLYEKAHQMESSPMRLRPPAPDAEAMVHGKRGSPANKRERSSPPRLIEPGVVQMDQSLGMMQSLSIGEVSDHQSSVMTPSLPAVQAHGGQAVAVNPQRDPWLGRDPWLVDSERSWTSDGCTSPRSARSVGSVGSDRSAFRGVETGEVSVRYPTSSDDSPLLWSFLDLAVSMSIYFIVLDNLSLLACRMKAVWNCPRPW